MRHCQTFSRTVAGWLTLIVVTVGWNLVCPPLLADSPAPSFDPVEREVEGWQVDVDPALFSEAHAQVGTQALAALGNHLQRVKFIVPAERVKQLQEVRIWLELKHPQLDRMQYHPNRAWLVANGHDPRLAKHVHIPVAAQLFARNMWAQHPYVVLHELAHAYHDQVLSFDQPEVIAVYDAAKENGLYEKVLSHTGQTVRHYGMNDHKEYFAESTEAYFGVNDFYPFVRAELKTHDPRMFALLEKIWGPVP
ncbi:metallopeptidase [Gimesia sp.]|uniref:metallopeptidase n=1 Tax=Gimesia sp. TaxID=2024833 RepID=UPI0032EB0A94